MCLQNRLKPFKKHIEIGVVLQKLGGGGGGVSPLDFTETGSTTSRICLAATLEVPLMLLEHNQNFTLRKGA